MFVFIYKCVCVCVCVCVRTLLSIYMSKMSGRDHENLYVCVYICVGFFFIITLVDLHNTHVLNYTINNNNKNCIPNTRKLSQAYFQSCY